MVQNDGLLSKTNYNFFLEKKYLKQTVCQRFGFRKSMHKPCTRMMRVYHEIHSQG